MSMIELFRCNKGTGQNSGEVPERTFVETQLLETENNRK